MKNKFINLFCCRGRIRTSTGRLAIMQSPVVNPGLSEERLYTTFIPLSQPSRREGMSAKNFITPQCIIAAHFLFGTAKISRKNYYLKIFQGYFMKIIIISKKYYYI